MATAQMQRNQNKSWEAMFPNEQLTEQKSALFMKKLLAVAVSNITYLRNIFPENAYGDKCLEDLNLKILRDQSSCPGASQVIKWVKGTFDALDKKYLRSLVIGIYLDPKKPETVIESYTFKFSYQKNGAMDIYRNESKIAAAYSAEETKKATIKLLRNLIILTSAMGTLPENVMMTMKLFYYDEVTPADYEPPGFRSANGDPFVFNEDATNIAVGDASTAFHTMKMRVKTQSKQFNIEEEHDMETNIADSTFESTAICDASLDNEALSQSQQGHDINSEKACSLHQGEMHSPSLDKDPASTADAPTQEEDEFKVRCPCGCNEDDGLMIMCSKCKFWQHGVCFLITNEMKAPENHICDICAEPGNPDLDPTDPNLSGITSIAVQATCLWRRALTVCTEFKQVVAPQLARRLGIEVTVAQGLINRLEKEGFVTTTRGKGKKLGKKVDKEKIESEGIPLYLRTPLTLSNKLKSNTDQGAKHQGNILDQDVDKSKDDKMDEDVESIVDGTNNMDINLNGRRTSNRNSKSAKKTSTEATTSGLPETTGRKGRKRARSKTTCGDFEICNSQESVTASSKKKKASIVAKDIRA